MRTLKAKTAITRHISPTTTRARRASSTGILKLLWERAGSRFPFMTAKMARTGYGLAVRRRQCQHDRRRHAKDTAMTDIVLMKVAGGALAPVDQQAVNYITKLKLGAAVTATVRRHRNPAFHRKFFALLNLAFESWEPVDNTYK